MGKKEISQCYYKKDVRRYIGDIRRQLSEEQLAEKSRYINEALMKELWFREAECIYVYVGCKGEVLTDRVIAEAFRQEKRVAVPRIEGQNMKFRYIQSMEELFPGYFGIPEPSAAAKEADEEGLVIMPGLAFDLERHRIGYGRGFYDRYLTVRPNDKRIALAFDFQVLDNIEYNQYDILPQRIITENRRI